MKNFRIAAAIAAPVVSMGLLLASVAPTEAGTTLREACAGASGGITVNNDDQLVLTVAVGDQVTIAANGNNSNLTIVIDDETRTSVAEISPGQTVTEAIEEGDATELRFFVQDQLDTAIVTCVPGGSLELGAEAEAEAEEDDSEVVVAPSTEDVQNAFSAPMMMSHLGALYDDVHRNTAGVLSGAGNQSVSQNDLFLQSVGKAAKDVPGSQPTLNVFVAADVTSFDGDSFDGLTGNLTLGMDYRVNRDVVVGALVSGGRADFSTLIGTNVGSLESTGYTLGLYGAAKVFGDVTVDGIVTYSGLDYDVANGTTTGDFDANRFGISLGIYNQMPFMGAIIEPHARVIYGIEEQGSYTDSVGRSIGSKTVNAGRIVLGPRLIAPMANGFTPWISANGVYEFSDSGNLATGAPDFDETFSGTVGLGIDWASDLGRIGGELEFGGLGSGLYHSISGTVQYTLEF